MMEKYPEINAQKFERLEKLYSGDRLTEGQIRGMGWYQGRQVVCTGMFSDQKNEDFRINLQECVPLLKYQGDMAPLSYGDHWREVNRGNRPRDYHGMVFRHLGRVWVFTDWKIRVRKAKWGQQISLL